jgi:hypothetical protein
MDPPNQEWEGGEAVMGILYKKAQGNNPPYKLAHL